MFKSSEANKDFFKKFCGPVTPGLDVEDDEEEEERENNVDRNEILPSPMSIGGRHLKFLRKIGEGGFSFVFEAQDTNGLEKFAVKRLLIQNSEQRKQVNEEIKIMKKISHRNLIKLHGVESQFRSEEGIRIAWLLMELGENSVIGIMNERLKMSEENTSQSPYFTEHQILRIFYDLCCGVSFLHSCNPPILHRDLKIENVLQIGDRYKLCDFGSCTTRIYDLSQITERRLAEEDINSHTTAQTRSPEMIDLFSGHPITQKSDIFSLGCVLYKLLFFEGPYDVENPALKILTGKFEFPPKKYDERKKKCPAAKYSQNFISNLKRLIFSMLQNDPTRRPDVFQVLKVVGKLLGDSGNEDVPRREASEDKPNNIGTQKEVSERDFDSWDPFGDAK